MKKTKPLIITLVCLLVLMVGVTYAAYTYTLREVHNYISDIETFEVTGSGSIHEDGSKYCEYSLSIPSNSSKEINVTVSNIGNIDQYYDLVIINSDKLKCQYTINDGSALAISQYDYAAVYQNKTKLTASGSKNYKITIQNSGEAIDASTFYIFALKNAYIDDDLDQSLNVYVQSEFDIRKRLNSSTLNDLRDEYRNVSTLVFINSFSIDEDLIINIPCNYQLLCSEIMMNGNISIKHSYEGIYYIDKVGDGAFVNETKIFSIDALNAFYYKPSSFKKYVLAEGEVNEGNISYAFRYLDNFVDNSNIELLTQSEYKEVLLDEAKIYIENLIPNRTINDLYLPSRYLKYGISFNYEYNNNTITSSGHVTRSEDSTDTTVTVTISIDGIVRQVTKNIEVIGTSDEAINQYAIDYLQEYINGTYVYNNIYNDYFMGYSITLPYQTPLGQVYNYVDLTDSDGEEFLEVQLLGTNPKYLRRNIYVTRGDNLKLDYTISINESSFNNTATVKVSGLSDKEKVDKIKAYMSTFIYEFIDDSSTIIFPTINTAGFEYYGLETINYRFYEVEKTFDNEVNAIGDDGIVSTDLTEKFSVIDGELLVKDGQNVKIGFGKKLIVEVESIFKTPTENQPGYKFYRDIVIPEEGIGGSSSEKLVEKILSSLFDINKYTIDNFETDSKTVKGATYELRIVNVQETKNFVSLVDKVNELGLPCYGFEINIDNIPNNNTTVEVECKIYQQDMDNPIVQDYSFVVPGIYHIITDISEELYPIFLNYFNGNYEEESLLYQYVLTDEVALSDITSLDLSYDTLINNDCTIDGELNIKGVEYVNAREIILDNNSGLETLVPLASSSYRIVSMKNCQLTSNKLSPLYSCKAISELYLDNNNIINLQDSNGISYFYRAINKLSLNNNQVVSFKGLENVANLGYLYAEHNNVQDIYEILELIGHLKEFYFGDNKVEDDASTSIDESKVLGSGENNQGKVTYYLDGEKRVYMCSNIVYYYILSDYKVDVYLLDENNNRVKFTQILDDYLASDHELRDLSSVMSSIEGARTYTSVAKLANKVNIANTSTYRTINLIYTNATSTINGDEYEFTSTLDIQVVLSIIIGNVELYRYYNIEKG